MYASSASAISPAATYERGRAVPLAKDGDSMPRVLIADDEDSMRTLVARAIAMDGHHDTVTAEDGAEALEILMREHGAFDLLLTDIQIDRKSTRLNSSHRCISYAVFCL